MSTTVPTSTSVATDGSNAPGEPTTVGFVVGPMSFVQKLDGAFGFLRIELGTMLAGAAALVLPPALIAQLAAGRTTAFTVLGADLNNDPTGTGAGSGWSALASFASSLWLSWGTLALGVYAALLLRRRLAGEDVSARSLLGGTLRRMGGGTGAWALHLVALGIGFMVCGIGVLVPMTWFLVIGPVIGLEDAGFRGLGRSMKLTQSRFGATLLVVGASSFLTLLLAVVPTGVVDLVVALLDGTTLPTSWEWAPRAAAGLLATAAAGTVAVSVALTTYVDLRCRREGWDLLSRMTEEFPPPRRGDR
ncbi:MAG: hypothetical protein R2704_06250 [Microthrixaceae bacterium]|nr:hypothetical protein [Microthrixaceae bacterium]